MPEDEELDPTLFEWTAGSRCWLKDDHLRPVQALVGRGDGTGEYGLTRPAHLLIYYIDPVTAEPRQHTFPVEKVFRLKPVPPPVPQSDTDAH